MTKKNFNPHEWEQTPNPGPTHPNTPPMPENNPQENLEALIRRIEASHIDITPDYAAWRNAGFALVDAYGEKGRDHYHRISRNHPNYNPAETNRQYNKCLRSTGHGVTQRTLYHLARQAGINTTPNDAPPFRDAKPPQATPPPEPSLPTFPAQVYEKLPYLLRQATRKATSPEDRDLLLLGSLVALSACLPNTYGIYAERQVYPNLFLFVTAQASAGKGRLTLCRHLVEPIHQALRQQAARENEQYQQQMTQYAATKNKAAQTPPAEPPLRMLIIPANNSSTGLFQILHDNQGIGLIFETEGDTLAQTFKSEHGNYSDGFRKAFHHETISYNRRKDREYVELTTPRLSALLSGTPRQVATLIPNAENGLFSRFIFYAMNMRPVWNNVFATSHTHTLDHYFNQLGQQFANFYQQLQRHPQPRCFTFTTPQEETFNTYFEKAQNQYIRQCGMDYLATVRRLGLITFRIAMIITTLRQMETYTTDETLTCSDADFETALALIEVLMQHAAHIYRQLPAPTTRPITDRQQHFFDTLPQEFTRKEYITIANQLGIPPKTAEKQITRFIQDQILQHVAYGIYQKKTSG